MTPFQKLLRIAHEDPEFGQDLAAVLTKHRASPIDHGYDQALAGGTDVMKRLQDELLVEQDREPRDPNPRLAGDSRQRHLASELQRRLVQSLHDTPGLREAVRDAVKQHAANTKRTVVVNAAVDDIIDAAVAVAIDPERMGQILAKHTTPE